MALSESEVQSIVLKVLSNIQQSGVDSLVKSEESSSGSLAEKQDSTGVLGVFGAMEAAIDAARIAYAQLSQLTVEDRQNMIEAIRQMTRNEAEIFSEMGLTETRMGNLQDKVTKHLSVANLTPGTEDLDTEAYTGSKGTTLIESTAFGIIGAITPSTNSSETIICNVIGMLAAGNVVVFNPHPGAKYTSAYAVKKINEAVIQAGSPCNVAFTIINPTIDSSRILFQHPDVKLLVGTGGPALTEAILKSGKKAICAGAGNPPVIVDETADLAKAARDIIAGATLDNNMLCIAEKECIVLEECAEDLIYHFMQQGAYFPSKDEVVKLESIVLTKLESQMTSGCTTSKPEKKFGVKKEWIGQDVHKLLAAIGVTNRPEVNLIVCEVDEHHPFVMKELMMPILPLVRAKDFDEAMRIAVQAEGGNRHSAYIHSNHLARISQFARIILTTIFVVNGPSFASIGVGGEGFCSFTIAGVTGEGITSPRSFTRKRRLVLSGGSLNLK